MHPLPCLSISRVDEPLELRLNSETEHQADFEIGTAQIVEELTLVNAGETRLSLYFHEKLAIHDEIDTIRSDDYSVVASRDRHLPRDLMPRLYELDFKCSDVGIFQEPIAHPSIHGVETADHGSRESFEQERHALYRWQFPQLP